MLVIFPAVQTFGVLARQYSKYAANSTGLVLEHEL